MKLPFRAFPRPGKSWLLPGLALLIGLIAAFAANRFLSGRLADIEARARKETIDVVVARRDMSRGDALSAERLALRAVPKDYAQSGAVRPEEFRQIEGRVLQADVKGGEMILWGLLQPKKPPSFSARVQPGRRAMTVAVDEINSVSGMLEPGDLIDLIASFERRGKKFALPLLQSVRVMATGQRAAEDPASGERRQFSTVTIDLMPQQAAGLVLARESGRLTALLRNPGDRDGAAAEAIDIAALLAGGADGDEVPVLYGGSQQRLEPEALSLRATTAGLRSAGADGATGLPIHSAPRADGVTSARADGVTPLRADGAKR
jgi:pilus assembly protein CpaB